MKIYTHKNVEFCWWGGLNVSLKDELRFLKLTLNNGSPSWRLNRNTWLSVKQLKNILES